MWIINDDGFFSAVQDWDDNDWVFVRSRSETDLNAFEQIARATADSSGWQPEILHTPHRDYQWRVRTPKHVWAQYLAAKAADIDYGNFKNHCSDTWASQQRDYTNARLSVLNNAWLLFNHWPTGELFEEDFSPE